MGMRVRNRTFRRVGALLLGIFLASAAALGGAQPARSAGVCGWARVGSSGSSVPVSSTCTEQSHPRCLPGTGFGVVVEGFICVMPP